MLRTSSTTVNFAVGALMLVASILAPGPVRAQVTTMIERIEPVSGPPGTVVQIVGRGFEQGMSAFLGDRQLEVTSRLPSRWAVRVPEGATTGPISLRGRMTANGPEFRVTAALAQPHITRITPPSGTPGSEITIEGDGFSPRSSENAVRIGSTPLVVRSATPYSIVAIVPDGVSTGAVVVRVASAGEAMSTTPFTVEAPTAITALEPAIGPAGTRVSVRGTGFATRAADNRVFMNNVPVRVERATATELVVVIPRAAANGPIVVDVRTGGRATSPAPFVVADPPRITALEPTLGIPGTELRIHGASFGTDVRVVTVGFAPAPGTRSADAGVAAPVPATVRSVNPTEIVAVVPEGASTGAVTVAVSTLATATSPAPFRILVPAAVTGFEPTSGPAGSRVTISGVGFSSMPAENNVTLSGVRATVVTASETSIVVLVPTNAPSGPLEISVVGNRPTRTPQPFVVTRPPTISGFSPSRVVIGGELTVRGTAFGTNPALLEATVGGRPVQILNAGETTLTARVTPGAATGPIVVTVRLQGTATSRGNVEVVDPLAIGGFAPISAYPGQTLDLTGTGFEAGMTIQFSAGASSVPEVTSTTNARVVVPLGATTGPIIAVSSDGRNATSSASLTVTERPANAPPMPRIRRAPRRRAN